MLASAVAVLIRVSGSFTSITLTPYFDKYVGTDVLAYAVAVLIGVSGSFTSNVRGTVYGNLFGRQHLGTVIAP